MPGEIDMDLPIVFIIGLPRSGTTMLELMLDGHSQLSVCPEISTGRVLWRLGVEKNINHSTQALLLLNYFYRYTRHLAHPIPACFARQALRDIHYPLKTPEWFNEIIQDYLKQKNAHIYLEKTPENTFFTDTLMRAFPQSKYLIIIRDPFDILASLCTGIMAYKKIALSRKLLLSMAIQVKRGMKELYRRRPFSSRHHLIIKYEDLVEQPDDVLRQVCTFLQVEFEPQMLEFQDKRQYLDRHEQMHLLHHRLNQKVTKERVGTAQRLFTPGQVAFLNNFWALELQKSPYPPLKNEHQLTLIDLMWLHWGRINFYFKLYLAEEYLNKLRFTVHALALRTLTWPPFQAYFYRNLIYKKEDWTAIAERYLKYW